MFAELATLLLAAQQIVIPLGHPRVNEQPRAPIETAGPLWASNCEGSSDRNKAAPPVRIHANSYLVGTCGLSSILIVGDQGDILIDGGEDDDADLIADNIRELGYSPRDIRFILHSDDGPGQLGGIAKLQRLSGATVVASAAAAKLLRTGRADGGGPQASAADADVTVAVGRIVSDASEVRLGNVLLTAIATPAHSPGGLSWRWESCDGGVCRTIVYAGSLAATASDADRLSDHPAESVAVRASIARIAASPCEILVTSEPAASDMRKRLVLGEPLFDADACKSYAAQASAKLGERTGAEQPK
jgi:metallo-beta-lactamase class B